MLEHLNDKDYYLYYIKNNEKIIAAIYANYICERLYLLVIAVDKNYRLQGISRYLINNVVDLCDGKVKEIHVWPNILDKDKSYSYYLHNGFKPVLYISNYEGVDLNDYNKYGFEIYESKIENYHSEGIEYSFCNYKYYVDSPKEEYISYYEKTIPNILAWYIFIKKIQDN
ncbi:MAG: GNAT family N-acetyltransferase [Bacilli bacterium]|nr:GNAT family N-acetyltransferase [Bacilli bacterium]